MIGRLVRAAVPFLIAVAAIAATVLLALIMLGVVAGMLGAVGWAR